MPPAAPLCRPAGNDCCRADRHRSFRLGRQMAPGSSAARSGSPRRTARRVLPAVPAEGSRQPARSPRHQADRADGVLGRHAAHRWTVALCDLARPLGRYHRRSPPATQRCIPRRLRLASPMTHLAAYVPHTPAPGNGTGDVNSLTRALRHYRHVRPDPGNRHVTRRRSRSPAAAALALQRAGRRDSWRGRTVECGQRGSSRPVPAASPRGLREQRGLAGRPGRRYLPVVITRCRV